MQGIYQKTFTLDEIRKKAPSVFATEPSKKTLDNYLFIPTVQILEGLQKNGFEVVSAKQQGTRTNNLDHAKHVLHLVHRSQLEKGLTQGEYPILRMQNSHDAGSSFQVDTGIYRLVCSNGLVIPKTQFNSARIIHNQNTSRETIEASFRILDNAQKEIELIDQMKSITLNAQERKLLADMASNLVFDETTQKLNRDCKIDLGTKLLTTRRREDRAEDLWITFNVIQENSIRGGLRIARESKSGRYINPTDNSRVSLTRTREVKSIDTDKKLNVQLMTLAQKMAEIKTA